MIGARFAWNIPYAQKSIWTHSMELLDDVCHMVSHFGLFGDSVERIKMPKRGGELGFSKNLSNL